MKIFSVILISENQIVFFMGDTKIVIKTLTCIPQIISLLFSFFAMYSVCTHGLVHHVTPTLCLEASTNMYICECHLY